MAVVEKPSTKSAMPANPAQRLALASLAGAVFLLVCLGLIFSGLPIVWEATIGELLNNPYLSTSLLLIVSCAVAVGLVFLGLKLEGPDPLPGLRAGSFFGFVGLFLAVLVTIGVANLLAHQDLGLAITWGVSLAIGGALVAGMYLLLQLPGFSRFLVSLEHQGWFHATSFKPNQGRKVRIGTQVALLCIIIFGVWSGMRSDVYRAVLGGARWPENQMTLTIPGFSTLELFDKQLGVFTLFNPQNSWYVPVPVGDLYLFLLFNVHYTVPLILVLVLLWLTLRVTNWPTFADFLIATEAEMNKVSWTTRKRLIQDTIVVLVTVVLLTVFLFVVDILWIRILSVPGVLQFDPQKAQAAQRESSEW